MRLAEKTVTIATNVTILTGNKRVYNKINVNNTEET